MKFSYIATGSLIWVIVLMVSCHQNRNGSAVKKAGADSAVVFVLQKDTINKQMTFPSELIPLERAELFAKVAGYVKSMKVDIGDRVPRGAVLAILEAPEMNADYARSNAEILTARSRYLGSLDAYKRIVHAAKVEGTIAAGELEKIRSQMLADSAALTAARSKSSAYGQLKDYLTIRAPFNGVITQRNVDPGTLVSPGNPKPLLVVENTQTLRLRVPVPESFAAAGTEMRGIHFSVDAHPEVTYQATLSRKSGAIDQVNRTELWEFLYVNTGNQLKPGMFANARLKLERQAPGLVVPSSAIATNLERRFVIRLKDGKTQWVDIRNGISMGDKMEIFGNLNEGDTLLVRATDEIKEDLKLVPKFQQKSH